MRPTSSPRSAAASGLERQLVRPRQRLQPAEEGVAVLLAGAALGLGLAGQRLDQGEQVLDPVPELAEQQLLPLLAPPGAAP